MLTTAVVSADAASSERLRAALQQSGLVREARELPLNTDHQIVSAAIPDVVLLDLNRETAPLFALAAALRRARPSVHIIACSTQLNPDPELLLQAMRSGVQEFLPKPVQAERLDDILQRVLKEFGEAPSRSTDQLIVVMGSKGGVGATTVAVNLATQLARMSSKRVVLMDYARPLGHVSLMLDIKSRFSIRDAAGNLDRLDSHFLMGLLSRNGNGAGTGNLDVLAGASSPSDWESIPVEGLSRVLNVARSVFDYVVADFGTQDLHGWIPLMRHARLLLLVTESNVPALWSLERLTSALIAAGIDAERMRVVANRWTRDDEEVLKPFEKSLKRPIFARLPNDYRKVAHAINSGTPLNMNHNNPLLARYHEMAEKIIGCVSPTPAATRARPKGLFGFSSTR